MMNGRTLYRGFIVGTISGIGLGILFKLFEWLFHIPIYTLLLAIDFIPFLDNLGLGEPFEFTLHMLISLIIGIIYMVCTERFSIRNPIQFAVILTLPTHLLYFLLVGISTKTSLTYTSYLGILLWIIGHLFYAFLLGWSYKKLFSTKH